MSDSPSRIERYQIDRVVREGSLGAVYRATDLPTGDGVALKVLASSRVDDRVVVGRFLREARAMRDLDHPGIVPVLEIGRWQETYFIAMPWVEGRDLKEVVDADGPLPMAQLLDIAQQVAAALAYAHDQGMIHRDVKPANIVLQADGKAIVVDFGFAKRIDQPVEQLTQTGATMGTPHYMSPEQVGDAKHVDYRSDIYSLGATLYHLLTGRPPFEGRGLGQVLHAVMTQRPRTPRELRPETPPALTRLLLKMLTREVAGRPASMRAVCEALEAIEG